MKIHDRESAEAAVNMMIAVMRTVSIGGAPPPISFLCIAFLELGVYYPEYAEKLLELLGVKRHDNTFQRMINAFPIVKED